MSQRGGLDITHLNEVIVALRRHSFPTKRYDRLGLSLGLLDSSLKIIGADYSNNVEACLQECLSAWLRKADNVEDPTYETLIAALRAIEENAVADGIKREKFLTVYDRSRYNASNGEHAVKILNRHIKYLRQLRDPVTVATFLHQEEGMAACISKETLSDMKSYDHPLEERAGYLIRDVRKAVKQDYTKLRVFANVCEKVSGNEDIGRAILTDYEAAFRTEDPSRELDEVLSEFKNEIDAGNPSDELLMKFKAFINRRHSIQITTAREGVSVIARKCTVYDMSTLEEVTKELNLAKTETSVDDYKQAAGSNKISDSADSDPVLLEMEKLTIVFECDHSVYQVEREQLLQELFDKMAVDVVKMCYSKEDKLICSFPPIYATLLMKIILQKSGMCQKRGIKSITLGYAPVWNRDMLVTESAEDKIKTLQEENSSLKEKLNEEGEQKRRMLQNIEHLEKTLKSQTVEIQQLQSCLQTDREGEVEDYGNKSIRLYKPSLQQCVDAIGILKDAYIIYFHTSSLDSIRAVLPILIEWKAVKKLWIYETPWTYESIRYLCNLLDQVPLEQLSIEKSTITDEAVEVLTQRLQGNTSITHLYLHENPNMTSASARSLSELLHCNSTLTHLSLWGTSITFDGANVLFDTLATSNKTLQKLTLDRQNENACSRHANYQVIKARLSFL